MWNPYKAHNLYSKQHEDHYSWHNKTQHKQLASRLCSLQFNLTAVILIREEIDSVCNLATKHPICSPYGQLHIYILYIYHMQFDRRPAQTHRESRPFSLSQNQIGSKLESDWTDNRTRGANRWRGVRPELQRTYKWLTDHFSNIQTQTPPGKERERERGEYSSQFWGEIATVWVNKPTISFLPRSAGQKLQNCLDGVQAHEGICAGSLSGSTQHFHTKKIFNQWLMNGKQMHVRKQNMLLNVRRKDGCWVWLNSCTRSEQK